MQSKREAIELIDKTIKELDSVRSMSLRAFFTHSEKYLAKGWAHPSVIKRRSDEIVNELALIRAEVCDKDYVPSAVNERMSEVLFSCAHLLKVEPPRKA